MYARHPDYLSQHPSLQARMRAILLDWLTEVSTENVSLYDIVKKNKKKMYIWMFLVFKCQSSDILSSARYIVC